MDGLTIFEQIKNQKKEYILFKYDELENEEELRLFSLYLMNKSSNNICESPITKSFMHILEKKQSIEAIEKGVTNFKLEDVQYTLNKFGYRISKPLENIKDAVGVFGCSYTFGIGVPEDKTYSYLLENKIQQPVYNFGIPGGNIQKIAKAFISINNFYKLKTAVFVLPSLYRYEFIKENGDYFYQEDFIPNFPPYDNPNVYNMLYEEFGDVTFYNEFIKNLNLIKFNAKINNTQLYITTWCKTTMNFIQKYNLNFFNMPSAQFIESQEQHNSIKVKDFARDGFHPGIRSHIHTSNLIYNSMFPPKK